MATVYFDTSALIRRYKRTEPGSAAVIAVCHPRQGNELLTSQLTSVEVASALGRWAREGSVPERNVVRVWNLFNRHRHSQYSIVGITPSILANAERLVLRYPLRAFDALHVACAIAVLESGVSRTVEFWTADRQQAAAADRESLVVHLVV